MFVPAVVAVTVNPSPISTVSVLVVKVNPLCIYVFNLLMVAFLLVPPAPSSTANKSASTKAAPISVIPSISKLNAVDDNPTPPPLVAE